MRLGEQNKFDWEGRENCSCVGGAFVCGGGEIGGKLGESGARSTLI